MGTGKSARPTTGFTRVRAPSQGVCVSSRPAEADKLSALTAPAVVTSHSALDREGSGLFREFAVSLDEPPCSTWPLLLAGLPRSCYRRTPQTNRRSLLAVSIASHAAGVSEARQVHRNMHGHACPSPASEQVVPLRTTTTTDIATSRRTRRTQRVLHEERNARQRPPAGREPHRHH